MSSLWSIVDMLLGKISDSLQNILTFEPVCFYTTILKIILEFIIGPLYEISVTGNLCKNKQFSHTL